jgi:hypothetical protein
MFQVVDNVQYFKILNQTGNPSMFVKPFKIEAEICFMM